MSAALSTQKAVMAGRKVAGARVARPGRVAAGRPASVRVMALHEYPDPAFVAETVAAFPEKMVADAEEARALYDNGYIFLDTRPTMEYDSIGYVKGSVHVPYVSLKKRFEDGKMLLDVTDNIEFEEQLTEKLPDKSQPIMVADADGTKYLTDVLDLMDGMGYTNLVAVKGGFLNWYKNWDNKLDRRRLAEYKEDYDYKDDFNGDSCGIHASGAGFTNQDACNKDFWANFGLDY